MEKGPPHRLRTSKWQAGWPAGFHWYQPVAAALRSSSSSPAHVPATASPSSPAHLPATASPLARVCHAATWPADDGPEIASDVPEPTTTFRPCKGQVPRLVARAPDWCRLPQMQQEGYHQSRVENRHYGVDHLRSSGYLWLLGFRLDSFLLFILEGLHPHLPFVLLSPRRENDHVRNRYCHFWHLEGPSPKK